MKRVIIVLFAFVMVITSMAGCSSSPNNNGNGTTEKRIIVDLVGDEVEIPAEVHSVVNLVPFGCQIMIGLGLGEYLVGVNEETIETPWLELMYPTVRDIPTYSYEPDAEAVLAANPDIVFCADQETAREFRSKGITAITIMYYAVEDFKRDIELIGEILGGNASEKCNQYLAYFENAVASVDSALKDSLPEKETLYYINGTSDRGFYKTTGAGSTNDEVAQLSYAIYATDGIIESPETKVDSEAILAENPQNVIIGGRWQHVLYDELFASEEWKNIDAIQNGNVFKVPMGMAAWNRYSIEIALMIPWTASVLYPEFFSFDAVSETISFYKEFTGIELSEKQATFIVEGLTPDGNKEIASR